MQISLDVDDAAGRVTMHMLDSGVMRLTIAMRPGDERHLAAYLRAALRPSSVTRLSRGKAAPANKARAATLTEC